MRSHEAHYHLVRGREAHASGRLRTRLLLLRRRACQGHTAEIVSLNFNNDGDRLITGSFDHTTKVWDVKSGR